MDPRRADQSLDEAKVTVSELLVFGRDEALIALDGLCTAVLKVGIQDSARSAFYQAGP